MKINFMFFRHFYYLFILASALTSCQKYLEKKYATDQVIVTKIPELQALLDRSSEMNKGTPSLVIASADDHFFPESYFYSLPEDFYRHDYLWIKYESLKSGNWATCYKAIFNANYCIDMLNSRSENIENKENESQRNNVLGSSLFFRAYYFCQVAWAFSKTYDEETADKDLGIVLRLTSDFTVPSTRSSVRETYGQIINDAKKSIGLLPDYSSHPFRPSKGAAYGLLARVYLSLRQYDSSWKYSNLYLHLNNELVNFNGDAANFNGATANYPMKKFNKEIVFYTESNTVNGSASSSLARVDTNLNALYEVNDIRKSAFFLKASDNIYYRFKGSYTESVNPFTGIATDEMLLTRAECYARMGEYISGMKDLNTLLSKRYNSTFANKEASNKEEALAKILTERRKELLQRGLRWMDLKRLNKEGANIIPTRIMTGKTYQLPPNDDRYALRIPDDIIAITGMPQN